MDNLELVIRFWVLWKRHQAKGGKWKELTTFFKHDRSFESAITKINDFVLNGNIRDLFNNDTLQVEIEQEITSLKEKFVANGIGVITYDQFHQYDALAKIKNCHWFFYKGRIGILKESTDMFVSVVGSRKTPSNYNVWINKHVPRKIIISGLATGADTFGHLWAIENKLPIVVFPGFDILQKPYGQEKQKIWEYASKHGLLMSSVFPFSKSFDKSIFIKRNKWMAQMANATYLVWFEGWSGALSHALESSKLNIPIFVPNIVLANNHDFLQSNKTFSSILESMKCI